MKKIGILGLLFLSAMVLIACTTNETDDSTPVISHATDKSIEQYTIFDPRSGVTALDDLDGDLTSKIEITGQVNTNIVAVYELTYKVTNSVGNTDTVLRKITVTEAE